MSAARGPAREIKVSQGARRRSWPGMWEAVCSDFCMWRWWRWRYEVGRYEVGTRYVGM